MIRHAVLLMSIAAAWGSAEGSPRVNVIPKPSRTDVKRGEFVLTPTTRIVVDAGDGLGVVADFLASRLRAATGFPFPVGTDSAQGNFIALELVKPVIPAADENYTLSCEKAGVTIEATNAGGVFYGVQTLLQLLPRRS